MFNHGFLALIHSFDFVSTCSSTKLWVHENLSACSPFNAIIFLLISRTFCPNVFVFQ